MNWKKILHSGICLLVVLAILLNCVPVKAEAVALEAALGIGVVACLILMTAGVVFNPQTVEDIQAIGQNFQSYMTQWGAENNKLQEVEEYIQDIIIINPFGAPDGSDDDDNNWSPNRTTVNLARGLLAGISLWVASIALNKNKVEDSTLESYYDYVVTSYGSDGSFKYVFSNTQACLSFLREAKINDLALIYGISERYFLGLYWDEFGVLNFGVWVNPFSSTDVYVFHSYKMSDLTLLAYCRAGENNFPIFFDTQTAIDSDSWGVETVCVIDWDASSMSSWGLRCYYQTSSSSSWSTYNPSFGPSGSIKPQDAVFYYPYSSSSVSWSEVVPAIGEPFFVGDVQSDLESGAISEEEVPLVDFNYADVLPQGKPVLESIQDLSAKFTSGELTVDQYLEMVQASDPNVGRPGWVKNIALSTSLTYTQGAAAEPLEVEVEVPEGSTAAYEWYRYGTDPEGNVYPVECLGTGPSFCPPTAEVGTAYYYCRAAVTDAQGMVAYNYSTSAEVEVVAGTTVEPGTGTDSVVNPDSIGQQDSKTFWEKLPLVITQPLEALGTTVVEGVRDIFVPSQDYLTDKVDTLSKQFPFITPVVTLAKTISLGFKDVEPEPPIIYLHLEDTRGSYDLGGTVPFIDMTWYAEYKPIGDALLSSLLWVVFIWRLFRQLPGLIAGMPGEYNARILDVLNVTPPSRSLAAEVHRQSNREAVRDAVKSKGAGKK